jgi:hypothetical protein
MNAGCPDVVYHKDITHMGHCNVGTLSRTATDSSSPTLGARRPSYAGLRGCRQECHIHNPFAMLGINSGVQVMQLMRGSD